MNYDYNVYIWIRDTKNGNENGRESREGFEKKK